MTAQTPMEHVASFIGFQLWWASPWSSARFTEPGLILWVPILKKHIRLVSKKPMYDREGA